MMRKPLPESGKNRSRPRTIPAPVGGWNALDSLADMPPSDAVMMENFFPRASDVISRKGSVLQATITGSERIETLFGYKSATGVSKIFAACDATLIATKGFYNITNGGAVVKEASFGGNAQWQYANVTTAGGSYMILCNGSDNCYLYNGTTFNDLSSSSTPALTGIPSNEVTNVSLFKTRVILCRKNSLSFYYLPNNAIAGAATEFPLGSVFRKGGSLVATATWTLDSGNGPDDYFIAITSEGEMVVYRGTDPSTSATFSLVGVFEFARPLGKRCFFKIAGDTLLLTEASILPLSKALRGLDPKASAATRKIEQAYNSYTSAGKAFFGWQGVAFSEASMLLVNVPTLNLQIGSVITYYSEQFVMNTTTGAWTRFTGWNARCMLVHEGRLYFALKDKVYEGWTGTSDDGALITSSAKTAFNYLGTNNSKHVKMLCPIVASQRNLTLQLGVDMDFSDLGYSVTAPSLLDKAAEWNSATWNNYVWAGTPTTSVRWRSVNCLPGRTAAIRLRASLKDVSMTWSATDLIIEDGGLL